VKGASEVYVVDRIPEHPVKQIFALREFSQAFRPGEESMKGMGCAIDAVGYQAGDDKNPDHEKPTQVGENCLRLANPTGVVGLIGV
jgi:glutathione-independent formaldehyde dehydrogenase